MKNLCLWCKREHPATKTYDDDRTTYGTCSSCAERHRDLIVAFAIEEANFEKGN